MKMCLWVVYGQDKLKSACSPAQTDQGIFCVPIAILDMHNTVDYNGV